MTPTTQSAEYDAKGFYKFPEIPYGPGPTRLGERLDNPYELDNMRRAAEMLGIQGGSTTQKNNTQLQATHVYVKMTPRTGKEYVDMMEAAEKYDLAFQEQPIEFEVLYQGEDGYRDPSVSNEEVPPMYGAIPIDRYRKTFQKMRHEVIEELHIPKYETQLTFAAYVISGNEKDYEAVDGYCHPDCPNWPACLDLPELACTPEVAPADVGTLMPVNYGETPANFPAYIQDAKMGLNGEIQPFDGRTICDEIIGRRPSCPSGQAPVLRPIGHEPGTCRWECVSTGGNPGGGDPLASTCGCRTSTNRKVPGGKMILVDTQLGDEGVRRAKVRTTKYRWGFIWTATDTDDEGCWSIDKSYNVKRGKVQIVFKDRTSNRMVIRSLRGARVHNAFLEAVDFTWYLTRDDERWNNLCLKIEDDTEDNQSLKEQTFIAATTNNAVHEYYDDHSSLPSPGKIAILIHTMERIKVGGIINVELEFNAAPMFKRMDKDQISLEDPINLFAAYSTPYTGAIYTYWQVAKPDMFLFFSDGKPSDRFKRIAYHEMMHVSQYARFGPRWWEQFVLYMTRVGATDQRKPYGDGSLSGSGRCEIAEGMAEAAGNRFAAKQYGVNHSIGGSFIGFNYFDINAERLRFWNEPTDFIPEGLFYDLLDDNNSRFADMGNVRERFRINDKVEGISFERQLSAGSALTRTIDEYESSLIRQESGTVNSRTDIESLFISYGN